MKSAKTILLVFFKIPKNCAINIWVGRLHHFKEGDISHGKKAKFEDKSNTIALNFRRMKETKLTYVKNLLSRFF